MPPPISNSYPNLLILSALSAISLSLLHTNCHMVAVSIPYSGHESTNTFPLAGQSQSQREKETYAVIECASLEGNGMHVYRKQRIPDTLSRSRRLNIGLFRNMLSLTTTRPTNKQLKSTLLVLSQAPLHFLPLLGSEVIRLLFMRFSVLFVLSPSLPLSLSPSLPLSFKPMSLPYISPAPLGF